MNAPIHVPVLVREVLRGLDAGVPGVYIDGTLGTGGHAAALLEAHPRSTLIGLDVDELALARAEERLAVFEGRVTIYLSDYRNLPDLDIPWPDVRGVLLDLGLSSFQLDAPARGFSFNHEGPLDMRFDMRNKTTAHKILHRHSEARLAQVFREYGELRQARLLARRIISVRKGSGLETTTQLRRLVEEVCRWRPQRGKVHPAAKVFQALRIEVNNELDKLDVFLERVLRLLRPRARMAVITFHSLEDRVIKRTFLRLAGGEGEPLVRVLTKKPETPSEDELAANSRSHSAKLRIAERV
ncbi:MAG: 16S rRNA (cytosine(1402)-N(4))-methyltransferase [Candidatus Aminicenantes bacterium RBG_13_62_12]|nr:MAG: 16S rRNA (cytosine(1402)-N(4))-methyltransferase [Candidatus Aminicenantes bacterium RBG_13_62_12]